MAKAHRLDENWVHLGLGASVEPLEPFDGMEWYDRYARAHSADGSEARLVAQHSFTSDWDMWEMHPQGSELVLCLEGAITLHQENADGQITSLALGPGEYAINPPGVWHTADVGEWAKVLFITAGMGTEHRERSRD